MPAPAVDDDTILATLAAYRANQENQSATALALGISRETVQRHIRWAAERGIDKGKPRSFGVLEDIGYTSDAPDRTPQDAWGAGADVFERELTRARKEAWPVIRRPAGPFVVFHTTDEHVDDNCSALRLIEADIAAANEMDAIKCHGGDVLNNWPVAGRLAKQWAMQECSLPDSLLRMQHFFDLLQPHVATQGNHEEMNPYLAEMIAAALPEKCITSYWAARAVSLGRGRSRRGVRGKFLRSVQICKTGRGLSVRPAKPEDNMSWTATHYHQNAKMSLTADQGLVLSGMTHSLSCFLDADQLAALAYLALEVRRELLASAKLEEI